MSGRYITPIEFEIIGIGVFSILFRRHVLDVFVDCYLRNQFFYFLVFNAKTIVLKCITTTRVCIYVVHKDTCVPAISIL